MIKDLLNAPSLDLTAIAAAFDAMPAAERVAAATAMTARQQARLFDAAKGFRPLALTDLVPPGVPAMTGVAHEGINSLYLFRRFAKVFYRPDDPALAAKELWGFNRSIGLVTTTVGPGYYVAYDLGGGEVLVDYTRLPARPPPGEPRILSNSSRLSFFVYNNTTDVLRGVSTHVSIGRAARGKRILDNWFALCRTDPTP